MGTEPTVYVLSSLAHEGGQISIQISCGMLVPVLLYKCTYIVQWTVNICTIPTDRAFTLY